MNGAGCINMYLARGQSVSKGFGFVVFVFILSGVEYSLWLLKGRAGPVGGVG